jgi:hypothetical protein
MNDHGERLENRDQARENDSRRIDERGILTLQGSKVLGWKHRDVRLKDRPDTVLPQNCDDAIDVQAGR